MARVTGIGGYFIRSQDPNGLAISTGPTDELSPAATNGSSWAVIYHHELGDGSGIFHRGVK